jgi:hypothetical protein
MVRIMYEVADGVWQLPVVSRDAIDACLIRDVLVNLDAGRTSRGSLQPSSWATASA